MSDKPVDKPAEKHVDKSIMVLCRMEPVAGRFHDAERFLGEWFEFLKNKDGFKSVELICSLDKQIVWMEDWENRIAADKFTEEHVYFSDIPVRMLDCSRKVPSRVVYRKIH